MKAVAMLGDGWRLPTREDWDNLIKAAAKKKNTAGKNLKSTRGWDSGCWKDDNGNGTDDFGFSALPGGFRDTDGNFWDVGSCGRWWTTAKGASGYAYFRNMNSDAANVWENCDRKSCGVSVRCVKDVK